MDPRIEKLAHVLVTYSVSVEPGNWVVISTTPLGEELADACCRAVLKAGGHPTVYLRSERVQETILRHGNDEQLSYVSPLAALPTEKADRTIGILAPRNTQALSAIDPQRVAIQNKAQQPYQETFMRRWQNGELLWTGTQYPTEAAAQDAGMSLLDYTEFVFSAYLLQEPDPAVAWRAQGERQQRLIDWLQDKSEIRITGPDTDLRVNVSGRHWINDEGKANFPGGEIFTGPEESSTEGTIAFNFPAVYQGREITGIRLTFKAGAVVDARANSQERYLREMLAMDEGASRLGEFAFGTNPGIQRFTRNTLFDEKISGTLHMALGMSIPGTGFNQSALHWDMVYNLREGAEVTVDGRPFSRNGEFLI